MAVHVGGFVLFIVLSAAKTTFDEINGNCVYFLWFLYRVRYLCRFSYFEEDF